MRVLNFGSVNIDHVYKVGHFVQPGETIASLDYRRFSGGKGANQSIALARAGAPVSHAGAIGNDGIWLREMLSENGVDVSFLKIADHPTGHAVIQVDRKGENAIVLYGGANLSISPSMIRETVKTFSAGDFLLVQNETSNVPEMISTAKKHGMTTVFNPAPMDSAVLKYPLQMVDILILNETEAAVLGGISQDPDLALDTLASKYPSSIIVQTLGADGVVCIKDSAKFAVPACKTKVVDTTAAGDTFIGYFLADLISGKGIETAIQSAVKAAALTVSRPGAADSIPFRKEINF